MLTHWKEREPVYAARERRIKERLGYVPAYATAEQGGPVDVAPAAPRGGRRGGVTTPQDPSQGVSRAEFDDMVANLGIEEAGRREPAAAAARVDASRRRPPCPRARRDAAAAARHGVRPRRTATAGEAPKPKKPRNRKHGRPR